MNDELDLKLFEGDRLPVQGWGYCAFMSNKERCDLINQMVPKAGGGYEEYATYSNRICSFVPGAQEAMCQFVAGLWNANAQECIFIPSSVR